MASRTTSRKAGAAKAPARITRTTRAQSSNRSTAPGKRTAKASGTAAAAPASTTVNNKTGLPKLGKGALEIAVFDHMAANPKSEYTPADLARVLNRSSGAIANALAKFAGQGKVTQTSERPRRYRLTGARAARATSTRKR
jgi:hypothetical protein